MAHGTNVISVIYYDLKQTDMTDRRRGFVINALII